MNTESSPIPKININLIEEVPKSDTMQAVPLEKATDEGDPEPGTLPLTAASDAGEGSNNTTDEASSEELTVEEVSEMESSIAEITALKSDEAEPSSDEFNSPDSDEGISISEDEDSELHSRPTCNYKIYYVWFLFWMVAFSVGLLAYNINNRKDIMAARLRAAAVDDSRLLMMPREKWDDSPEIKVQSTRFIAERVIVLQTDTEICISMATCTTLLRALKRQHGKLLYNFFLSSEGCIYEALGWDEPSSLYPEKRTLVMAFIGNYENMAPSAMQLNQFQTFIEICEELRYLTESYTLVGKRVQLIPTRLFAYISAFDHWDEKDSDKDKNYLKANFDPFLFIIN